MTVICPSKVVKHRFIQIFHSILGERNPAESEECQRRDDAKFNILNRHPGEGLKLLFLKQIAITNSVSLTQECNKHQRMNDGIESKVHDDTIRNRPFRDITDQQRVYY